MVLQIPSDKLATTTETVAFERFYGENQTKIFVHASEVSEKLLNTFIRVEIPRSPSNQNSDDPKTLVRDLKRVSHLITIKGFITHHAATIEGNSINLTATQAKNHFIDKIIGKRSDSEERHVRLYWRGGSWDVTKANIDLDSKETYLSNPTQGNHDASNPADRGEVVAVEQLNVIDIVKERMDVRVNPTNASRGGDVDKYEVVIVCVKGEKKIS